MVENLHKSIWLKIFIPYKIHQKATAHLKNKHGDVLRNVVLFEGNNAIDISNINDKIEQVKVETESETILSNL